MKKEAEQYSRWVRKDLTDPDIQYAHTLMPRENMWSTKDHSVLSAIRSGWKAPIMKRKSSRLNDQDSPSQKKRNHKPLSIKTNAGVE